MTIRSKDVFGIGCSLVQGQLQSFRFCGVTSDLLVDDRIVELWTSEV
jgi:hypothetical protein